MDQELAGKVAVVTGASRGIGLAIVRALAAEGAQVVAGVRSSNAELESVGGSVQIVTGDLATADGPGRLIDAAVAAHGRLDVLVNNIGGVRPRLDGFAAVTDDDWLWAFATNLMPAVRATRAALPHLLASAPSSIVTISSVNAVLADPAVIDYSAAKAALSNFSKSLSREVGPQGVRVNTISPGPVATDLWLGGGGVAETIAARTGRSADEVAAGAAADSATGRFTRPDEVADLVVLLAGARAWNATGIDIRIDGGLVTTL
jgi:NAD(P)-dependent dehydrogenase (short-subunit alcohol dehydrogenase family)